MDQNKKTDKPRRHPMDLEDGSKVFIETAKEIEDSFILHHETNEAGELVLVTPRSLFQARTDATALWILRPGMKEPYRIHWRQALHEDRSATPKTETQRAQHKKQTTKRAAIERQVRDLVEQLKKSANGVEKVD